MRIVKLVFPGAVELDRTRLPFFTFTRISERDKKVVAFKWNQETASLQCALLADERYCKAILHRLAINIVDFNINYSGIPVAVYCPCCCDNDAILQIDHILSAHCFHLAIACFERAAPVLSAGVAKGHGTSHAADPKNQSPHNF